MNCPFTTSYTNRKHLQAKFSKYDKDSKYAPAFRYLGVQIPKYVLDCLKSKENSLGNDVAELVQIVLHVSETWEVSVFVSI